MRSRFAAYALSNADYIMSTTDPNGPHFEADTDAWRASILAFCAATTFANLIIRSSSDPSASNESGQGFVHFEAKLFRGESDTSFDEHSRFRKVDGRWFYTDALVGT